MRNRRSVSALSAGASNGKTSTVHYRTLWFFAIRFKKKTKVCFFRDFKYKITIEPVRFASILLSFNINQFASNLIFCNNYVRFASLDLRFNINYFRFASIFKFSNV
jgi:hypothetical protein